MTLVSRYLVHYIAADKTTLDTTQGLQRSQGAAIEDTYFYGGVELQIKCEHYSHRRAVDTQTDCGLASLY